MEITMSEIQIKSIFKMLSANLSWFRFPYCRLIPLHYSIFYLDDITDYKFENVEQICQQQNQFVNDLI
jgi:hypothetical protein